MPMQGVGPTIDKPDHGEAQHLSNMAISKNNQYDFVHVCTLNFKCARLFKLCYNLCGYVHANVLHVRFQRC
jgi:hypothetical protein